jgi:leucyl-tRNA synthetase
MNYDIQSVEQKWQKRWAERPYGVVKSDHKGENYYCLDMFPYPSGSGLHVGHWRGYVLSDVYARVKVLEGYNVLHPMGWDAFGLPAENAALKLGVHPKASTEKNIKRFKEQLKQIGAIYDWSKELDTTDPDYYQWTQWIFVQMYKAGIAYEAMTPINWCPSCLTGIANEEVVNGACERCDTLVVKRNVRQWMLKITEYAEQLLEGLDRLDWPEKVKMMQRNWIGKSEGLKFTAPVKDMDLEIQTFSAHFESCFADTFVVIAPDHDLLPTLVKGIENEEEILQSAKKMVADRLQAGFEEIESQGIFTGRYIVDPLGNGDLPIWVASFAIADYGTGIVKCSAHDKRDFDFAKKYDIPLKVVLVPADNPELRKQVENKEICFSDMENGILLEPTEFAGRVGGECREEIITFVEKKGWAVKETSYRLRDWIFSRQRYWGEPIPLIHCGGSCGVVPVPEDQLPVLLPEVERYEPTGTGESPLKNIRDWVETTCPTCGGAAERETNTMPQWAGSCWYFLRYPNPDLSDKPFDQEDLKKWLPVDMYVGGIEHAILHLLYARFYVKFLHEKGFIPFDEPFKNLFNQGMVCKRSEKSGHVEKMSKSKGNVVSPDEMVEQYGSDVLRMYILFMGPPELDCEWQNSGIEGIKRFMNRCVLYLSNTDNHCEDADEDKKATRRLHKLIFDVQERLDLFKPNTVIAAFMEWLNDSTKGNLKLGKTSLEKVLSLLSVLAPHAASELLETLLGMKLEDCSWPKHDPKFLVQDTVTYAIQVQGKMRGTIEVDTSCSQEDIESQAKEQVAKWLEDKTIRKTIFIKNRMVNFVV